MEPMDIDEAQQVTDRLTQSIQNTGRLCRSGSLGGLLGPRKVRVSGMAETD